jgi:N-acetylglucosaminyldiphosphoundecaprenol N-acetyl-beta-D-mannosaminyltransferase
MIDRFTVIRCMVSKVNMEAAVSRVLARVKSGEGGYVCFANAHSSVTAYNNPEYLAILNRSFMTLPDGKPVYWTGLAKGVKGIQQIPGPDFLPMLVSHNQNPPLRHYFYGGRPEVIEKLIENLKTRYQGVAIVGWESPPFRDLSSHEDSQVVRRIKESMADIVWVGLGTPKQDYWMASHYERLKPAILFGVGAAFDIHADNVKRAPIWVRSNGFEWLYRLMQEPRRLWRRYLVTNSLFIIYVFKEMVCK